MSGSRVVVMGMKASGRAAASLAVDAGAEVVGVDVNTAVQSLEGVRLELGPHRRQTFLEADMVVVSPGVPHRQPDVEAAEAAGVTVVGEVGFAWSFLEGRAPPTIAVTGTNGKSTVTHFAGGMIPGAFVGGNLGNALSNAVGFDWPALVVELSSYQLERPGRFRPNVGVVLNLTPDHLARHGDMETYGRTKLRLFDQMGPEDLAILPAGDERLERLASGAPGRRLWLGKRPGVVRDGGTVRLALSGNEERYELGSFSVPGEHNRDNAATAALLARGIGVREDTLRERLPCLKALPHRMQVVGLHAGVQWINDSKATNVDACRVGVEGLERSAVVLLGGQAKEGSDGALGFEALAAPLGRHRAVVTFGASGSRIARELLCAGVTVEQVTTLEAAVSLARSLARAGEAILLSPGCASFDAYDNFEHRGQCFAALAGGE